MLQLETCEDPPAGELSIELGKSSLQFPIEMAIIMIKPLRLCFNFFGGCVLGALVMHIWSLMLIIGYSERVHALGWD